MTAISQNCGALVTPPTLHADGESSPEDGSNTLLKVSIGVATLQAGEPIDALLRRADVAVYLPKSSGRDQAVVG